MEKASRMGLSVASAVATFGFSVAKFSTSLGFGIGRGISSTAATAAGNVFDYIFLGSSTGTGAALGGIVSTAFNLAESLALAPILIGETITSTSLIAASSSLDVLSTLFGSDEASFSLASFVQLVRREWQSPMLAEHLPEERYSVTAMSRALVAWAAIQGVTHDYYERKWFSAIHELSESEKEDLRSSNNDPTQGDEIHVTEDIVLPDQDGQIVVADIGTPSDSSANTPSRRAPSREEVLPTLRRLSRMALAGYGGAGMIFFGVPLQATRSKPLIPTAKSQEDRNAELRTEEETMLESVVASSHQPHAPPQEKETEQFSWWNVLLGRHDQEIFESYAFSTADIPNSSSIRKNVAVVGAELRMPRFWVLTDHARKEVVLVLRGTMSFNELAVDLTCDPVHFNPLSSHNATLLPEKEKAEQIPSHDDPFQVHGGMLRMARVMGSKGRPVHTAVRNALRRNKDYELVLCGHSLGAGIAGLLALMWTDIKTCMTSKPSGLPAGRRVSGFLLAPPCLVSKDISIMCNPLLTSFVYSHDIVSRLSLGSIRDMTRAAIWLCTGKGNESPMSITKRAIELHKNSTKLNTEAELTWFLSLRKTLEANMGMAHLFPPGRVLWAINDQDLQPSSRIHESSTKLRLFEVLQVDKIFDQILFSRRMLGSHMPHQYDRIIHELE